MNTETLQHFCTRVTEIAGVHPAALPQTTWEAVGPTAPIIARRDGNYLVLANAYQQDADGRWLDGTLSMIWQDHRVVELPGDDACVVPVGKRLPCPVCRDGSCMLCDDNGTIPVEAS